MKSMRSLSCLFLAAVSLSCAPGCRFKSPSLAEQQELAAKGALSANNTDWAAAPLARGQQLVGDGGGSYQGGIPDYTRGSAPIDTLSQSVVHHPSQAVQTVTPPEQQRAPSNDTRPDTSPLDRISRTCPGTESQVNAALQTTDRAERIAQYEALTRQCPSSSELWMWLGVDYERDGKIEPAKHAFEQAVLLNPRNDEAKGHLAAVQRKVADAMRGR